MTKPNIPIYTCVFLIRTNENGKKEVLLAKKTRKIGVGCWNGYGGKVEVGEGLEDSAVREFAEETNGVILEKNTLERIAVVDFHTHYEDNTTFSCKVYFFTTTKWSGEIQETDEMATPTWFPIDKLPWEEFMAADKKFLPIAFAGKKVFAEAHYNGNQTELAQEVAVREVESL